MKKIILSLSLCFILSACTSDDSEPVNNDNNSGVKLVKETIVYQNSTTVQKYIYNNNLLIRINGIDDNSDQDDVKFFYEGNLLKTIKRSARVNSEDPVHAITITLHYSGKLIDSFVSSYDDNSSPTITYTNTYANNRLYQQTSSRGENGYIHQYFSDGNLQKLIDSNQDVFIYSSYDGKKNPYYSVYTEPYLLMQSYSPNNPVSITGNNNYRENFEYEYNQDNYPIKVIKRVNGSVFSTTTLEYNSN